MRLSLLVFALLPACPTDDGGTDDTADSGETADTGDTGGTDDTAETGDTGPDGDAYCAALGLVSRPWEDGAETTTLGGLATDFTVETAAGTFVLSQEWTGCDTYLFIPDAPRQAEGYPDGLWDVRRDVSELYARLPRNTHVFFASEERDDKDRAAALADLESKFENAIEDMSTEDQAWWRAHTWFVPEKAGQIDGWVGDVLQDPNWGFGIDRFQRIRYIGSFADPTRYNSSIGWFEPNISMAANEPAYYNFEADREERLAADGATVLPVFGGEVISDPHWAGQTGEGWLDLPDAATMATFDTAAFDHSLLCVGDGEYGTCPAWDYLNWLWLCDADDETNCPTEIGRWITTYHREGRWVHDVSGILPLLKEGGRRRVLYYTQQPYEVHLSLRLSNTGKGVVADGYVPMWTGGDFYGETYNNREPMTVAIPADATRVELFSVISGHGMQSPGNCAEFCRTDHHFYVNGVDHVRSFDMAGNESGCMDVVGSEGTVPNQYGTWWYGRNGWCPGKEVPMVGIDITADVVIGADNIFDYEGLQGGSPYTGTGANLLLSSWLVISK